MKVEQISIFMENKAGRLAEVTAILKENGVNIRALSLADTADFGVLRMIVDDTQKTDLVLKEAGFTVGKTEVVAVEVMDTPGGLHDILEVLREKNINVEYMYAFVQQNSDRAVMIFRFDDVDTAITHLSARGMTVVPGKRLYSM
ncbi:ACT domain-containing protein [Desulfobotulus mexicanus]|uniref:ACT domain-containing protein n=1 Tax=Desulfobotulus mexicanus TaxID=2586642 RepID=A0A5S5MCI5_9BACT|nr:ACT domain-containing protein [Desulfobotulus mexicanus]TYT73400.1 ACT domain-containing protein [Desulfobotulus mexicanus]